MPHALLINRNRTRANTMACAAVLDMLREDHKRAKKAFHEFSLMDIDDDPESARLLVTRTCAELTMHASLEESFLYPAARSVIAEEEMVDEAEVEHVTTRRLIDTLRKMSPTDKKYCAYFAVLGEYVRSHIREEELEMFPLLQGAKLDWVAIKQQMDMRRSELLTNFPEPLELVRTLRHIARAADRRHEAHGDEPDASSVDPAAAQGREPAAALAGSSSLRRA